MADIAALTDVFYIGGTKNGALFGEAVVILNPVLDEDFRYMIKQRGGMLAKGWLLGIQFETMFTDGLFYEMASHATAMADKLRKGLEEKGVSFYSQSVSNQLFPIFSDETIARLSKDFSFNIQARMDESHQAIRLVTSWATKEEAVDAILAALD